MALENLHHYCEIEEEKAEVLLNLDSNPRPSAPVLRLSSARV